MLLLSVIKSRKFRRVKMSKWYNAQGNNSDVVMSSKIRLARNLADAPFPSRMSNEIRKSV